jgi:hypothetical protein
VRSGTAVVEDVLLRRLQLRATRLHTIAISDVGAATRLAELARGATGEQMQQLQVRPWRMAS